MLAAPLGHDQVVLYDLVAEVVHVLNASAGALWVACRDGATLEAVVAELQAAGVAAPQLEAELRAGVRSLEAAGLVGRTTRPAPPLARTNAPGDGASASNVWQVVDERVQIRCADGALVAAADVLMASMAVDDAPTVTFGLPPSSADPASLLASRSMQLRPSADALLDGLPTALNEVAATTARCLTLHSGGARDPDGRVLLLPAVSGSGKSTLTAALVSSGWGYLSDEAIGLRLGSGGEPLAVPYPKPLVLSPSSRALLGLELSGSQNVVPGALHPEVEIVLEDCVVARVVLPRFEDGAAPALEDLSLADGLVAVLEHALNLARIGEPGLEALCRLVERVPVQRFVHGDVHAAVALLSA